MRYSTPKKKIVSDLEQSEIGSSKRYSRETMPMELIQRKRSRSFSTAHEQAQHSSSQDDENNLADRVANKCPQPAAENDAGTSSLLMSSYGEDASEINDSRFNDISCISCADRSLDEKDSNGSSKVNVSRETAAGDKSTCALNNTK